MLLDHDEGNGVVWLRVPLTAETVERLHRLSTICRAESTAIAASLLHDVLMDDALTHDEVHAHLN